MSEQKHTPGPWEVVECLVGVAVRPVGTVSIFDRIVDDSRLSRPNARLIAAAPELAEALKLAMDTIGSLHGHYCPDCEGGCPDLETIQIARAALEKAGVL